jgi:hypothetical protein
VSPCLRGEPLPFRSRAIRRSPDKPRGAKFAAPQTVVSERWMPGVERSRSAEPTLAPFFLFLLFSASRRLRGELLLFRCRRFLAITAILATWYPTPHASTRIPKHLAHSTPEKQLESCLGSRRIGLKLRRICLRPRFDFALFWLIAEC